MVRVIAGASPPSVICVVEVAVLPSESVAVSVMVCTPGSSVTVSGEPEPRLPASLSDHRSAELGSTPSSAS